MPRPLICLALFASLSSGQRFTLRRIANRAVCAENNGHSGDVDMLASGSEVSIAGEGLGPEPGKVIVFVAGVEREAQIEGWYDLGVRITLPELPKSVALPSRVRSIPTCQLARSSAKTTPAPTMIAQSLRW